jgi:hypothetical protein
MRRWISWIVAIVSVITVLTGCSLPQVSAEDRLFLPLSIDFLGSYTLSEKPFQETRVGGLSALTYDRQKDVYYAVSDDRSDRDPARFYTLKFSIDANAEKPTLKGIEIQNVTILKDENGQPLAKGTFDAEGIALSSTHSVFISSEGDTKNQIPPAIAEFDLQTGQLRRSLSLPEAFIPDTYGITQSRGIQSNRGFEALTLNAGASSAPAADLFRLFSVTEAPLMQDLELPKSDRPGRNRLLHYLLEAKSSRLISEHLYPLDPKPQGAIDHGLSELLSIDQGGHFLSLERSFGLLGFQVKLFQATTAIATDTSTVKSLRGELKGVQSMRKKLLLNLNELGIDLDNLEGMTIGARLPDGSQSLVLISDNNFNHLTQVTQILLFRLRGLKG